MEPATTVTVAQKSSGMSTMLIVVLIVVLVGGGVGAWFMLKPKTKDAPETTKTPSTDDGASKSRTNTSSQNVPLTAAQKAALLARTGNTNTSPPPPTHAGSKLKPYFVRSDSAQKLIKNIASKLQGDEESMDLIRMKYNIGRAIVEGQDAEAIKQFKIMIGKRPMAADGTLPDMSAEKYWLSFPIYGTQEQSGSDYRTELQNILNRDWRFFNLTHSKHGDAPWWCPKLGLNFLIGSTTSHTPDAHTVWSGWWSSAERDFYKGLNGHWVSDMQIADEYVDKNNLTKVISKSHPDAIPRFPAQKMFNIVDSWVDEIDRLDKVTEWEALRILMRPKAEGGEEIYFSFLDPNDPTKKFYGDYGVNEDPTVKDTDPLIKP